jgi:CRISPR/Cas system-associated endonuclease Cas1
MLQSEVQIKTVTDGYDPMLGIMHYERDGSPAFVFDMMEPERPKVDCTVLGFLKSEALHPADFTLREDGVARLNPELARRVARLVRPPAVDQQASLCGKRSMSVFNPRIRFGLGNSGPRAT